MRIDRGLVGLGLFLITAGGVALAVREGVLGQAAAGRAWTLWPLLLVGTGLSIALARRPGAWIGGLVVAVTLGTMLGGVIGAGWRGGFGGLACAGEDRGTAFPEQNGNLTPSSQVDIQLDCGSLALGTVPGSTWSLTGSSGDGRPPEVRRSDGRLAIAPADRGGFVLGGARDDWTLVVPQDIPLDLDVETNGGSTQVTLGGASLRGGRFSTNAGSLTLDLREVGSIEGIEVETNLGSLTLRLPLHSFSGSVSVNAGSAALCPPEGAGLRIQLDSVAASDDLEEQGLVRVGAAWETAGYATAEIRIDLTVDVNAGSLALDPDDECGG